MAEAAYIAEQFNPEASESTAAAKIFWSMFGANQPLDPELIKRVMRDHHGDFDEADVYFDGGVEKLEGDGLGYRRHEDGKLALTDAGFELGITATLGFRISEA